MSNLSSIKNHKISSWTYMVYFVGDMKVNYPDGTYNADELLMIPAINQMELSGSTSEVNIIFQADDLTIWNGDQGAYGGTRRFHIQYDDDVNEFANYCINKNLWYLDEKNMGDPLTLVDFVNWASENYPAEHYCLVLYGHGASWISICNDETTGGELINPNGYIDLNELEYALSSCVHLDILFPWACSMGHLDVFYQLRDYADIIIASESTNIYCNNTFKKPLENLTANPTLNPTEIAEIIVNSHSIGPDDKKILFGVPTCEIENLSESVNELAIAFLEEYQVSPRSIQKLVGKAFSSSKIEYSQEDFWAHELYEFAKFIQDSPSGLLWPNIYNKAVNVTSIIENSSIIKPAGAEKNLHGIAIYSPKYIFVYFFFVHFYKNIRFTIDIKWDEFLDGYYLRDLTCPNKSYCSFASLSNKFVNILQNVKEEF
jgi:hypothetical protein